MVPGRRRREHRLLEAARVERDRAAGVEAAAARDAHRVRRLACQHLRLRRRAGRVRGTTESSARVYGCYG